MTKPNIYDQHRAAFSDVSASIVLHKGKPVASVAFKYPRDGAGRLYAYVHWFGTEMVRGWAGGGGYDKKTAACADAMRKMPSELPDTKYADGTPHYATKERMAYSKFQAALAKDDGHDWDASLRNAGFIIRTAV